MKKSQFNPFVKARENREKLSNEFRNKYRKGNEKAVFDFIKLDRTNIKEEWVKKAIMGWIMRRDADRTLKLAKVFQKPCYTDVDRDTPEGKELARNMQFLGFVRRTMKASGLSENEVLDALEDLFCQVEEKDEEGAERKEIEGEVFILAKEQYPNVPKRLIEEFLAMDLASLKGERKRLSQTYLRDIITKRLKKYARIFPYLQK